MAETQENSTPLTASEIAHRLPGTTQRAGKEWVKPCPCHQDTHPSLYITEKDGKVVMLCRAGCDQATVHQTVCDLVGVKSLGSNGASARMPEAIYPYRDKDGHLLYEKVRWAGKDIKYRRPHPTQPGQYIYNAQGVQHV